jgi:hypothetical protein
MEKVSLPIKTKIAAWIMIIFGMCIVLNLVREVRGVKFTGIVFLSTFILISLMLLLFISGFSLLLRKRWAWWLAVFILSIVLIFRLRDIIYEVIFGLRMIIAEPLSSWEALIFLLFDLILLIPLILLLLDRKNFWKIAT